MLPIFRTIFVGGVLVMLALLAGFVAPGPSTLARPVAPARGALIQSSEHPEWKQFLIQAAYRRADELDRLRDLPDTPTIAPAITTDRAAPPVPPQTAALAPASDDNSQNDLTGSIDDVPGAMTIDIGEASATELPIKEQELQIPIERPETLPRPEPTPRKPVRRVAKTRAKPAAQPAQPDFFTTLFGASDQAGAGPR